MGVLGDMYISNYAYDRVFVWVRRLLCCFIEMFAIDFELNSDDLF